MKFKNLKKPIIIAEIGSNYNQNLNTAFKLIDMAKSCGATYAKFQLFDAESLYSKNHKNYKIFKQNELNPKWIPKLINYCRKKNILFLASVFDRKSASIIAKNKITDFKLASSELNNFNLLKALSKYKITNLIISTGMSSISDVIDTVNFCNYLNINNISLMQCSALYPAKYSQLNLNVIKTYKKMFNLPIGFSDHSLSILPSVTAVGTGAIFFEKHITLDKNQNGPDHHYALNPEEFKQYVKEINFSYKCLGDEEKKYLYNEKLVSRNKGLYLKKDVIKNQVIDYSMIEIKSPPIGIEAKFLSKIIGMTFNKNIRKKEPIKWEDFS
jgi:sialic acid synthase SpsE